MIRAVACCAAWRPATRLRSGPTMSAACCARPSCSQARDDHAAGRIGDAELRAVEDEAIRDVVRLQRDVGLRSATDGEFRRASWHMDFIYSLDGISKVIDDDAPRAVPQRRRATIEFAPPSLHVDGTIGLSETIFGDAFEFLQSLRRRRPDAEADDPVAEHGPLPRRARGDRRGVYPGHGRVLGRPHGRLPRAGPPRSASSAAPTCSSTTRASPTSTTRSSAST